MAPRRPRCARARRSLARFAAAAALLVASGASAEFIAGPADFQCFLNGTAFDGVNFRVFHSDPAQLAAAVALVESGDLSPGLPEGTILQVQPGEAMVKRGGSFNPAGNGWEFFRLKVTLAGDTRILGRGGAELINTLGRSCQDCHVQRAPDQDLVAGMTSNTGPFFSALFKRLQENDRRCR